MVDNLITLYDSNERNFTTNGLGALVDASECTVEEELNGAFELTMSYPIDGQHYTDLGIGKIIFAKPNQQSEKEPFRIYSISTPLSETVTVKAQHISYDLSGYILPKFNTDYSESGEAYATGPRTAFARIESELAKIPEYSDFPFTFYTDSDEDHAGQDVMYELTCPTPKSVRNMLGSGDGSMLSVYSGEYYFNRFTVNFLVQRGSDNGVTLRYGKNLTSLTVDEDASTLYSGVYPFWRGTVTEKDANGQDVQNEKCIELPEKIITITEDAPKNVYLMDLSSDYTSWPGDENVREIVEKYISDNALGLPFSSLKVSYEQLSKSNEYSSFINFDSVELGDYVTVEYGALLSGPQKVRCTKISYDVLLDKIESIDLGSESTLTDSISQQQSTLSNSTNYTREYVQEQLSNISYDTALSTTSTNAVQNKVVTSKFNSVDKTCNGFKNEINNILSIVENLNPSGGTAITYGYSLPTGGKDGDAYVQITSTPKDPRAVVSVSNTHNNFEVSNFKRDGDKYDFDITGTVDEDSGNYAVINVGNLTPGAEYKVKMRLSHDVPQEDLNVSYWQYQGGHWNKAFGIFVGQQDICYNYGRGQSGTAFENLSAACNPASIVDSYNGPSCNYNPYGDGFYYQGIYKDISDREYTFYFTATNVSAGLSFELDDVTDGKSCNFSIKNMEVVYVGTPILQKDWSRDATLYCPYAYNDNWSGGFGIDDGMLGLAWTAWGGVSYNGVPTPYGLTFNTPRLIDRMRLNVSEANWNEPVDSVNNRKIKIEGSKDNLAIDNPEKEWIVITDNELTEIGYPKSRVEHVYIDVAKDTYNNLRLTYTNPVDGKLSAWQMFSVQEQEDEIFIKDLFFKVEGEWKKYPRGDDEGDVFTYGTEDPSSETQGDIYAKVIEVPIDKGKQILPNMSGACSSGDTSEVDSDGNLRLTTAAYWGHGWARAWSDNKFQIDKDNTVIRIKGVFNNRGEYGNFACWFSDTTGSDYNGAAPNKLWDSSELPNGEFTIDLSVSSDLTRGLDTSGNYYVYIGIHANPGDVTITDLIVYDSQSDIDNPDIGYDIENILYKIDTDWKEAPSPGGTTLPSGGTTGQVLGKLSDDDQDVGWLDTGGGSGSGLTKTLLWDSGSDVDGAVLGTVYNLLDNLSNHDLVYIEYGDYNDRGNAPRYCNSKIYDTDRLLNGNKSAGFEGYSQRYCHINFTDTTFELDSWGCPGESSGYEPRPYKMYGLKFSGGSGGGGSACYNLIDPPITNSNSGTVGTATATSYLNGNFGPGMAFNGVQANSGNGQGGWLSTDSDQTPTLTLAFNGGAKKLDFIKMELLDNGAAHNWSEVYIEGSNDGSTWTNILKTGNYVAFDLSANSYAYYNIELDGNRYSYFRIRGTEPFYYTSSGYPACIFSNVLIYGNDD